MSPFPVDLDAEVDEEATEVDDAAKETQVRMEAVARAAHCEKVSACEKHNMHCCSLVKCILHSFDQAD